MTTLRISRRLRYRALSLFLCCALPAPAAVAAISDLLLLIERDGLSYTLQHTLQVEQETAVFQLPGSVVPLNVQFTGAERLEHEARFQKNANRFTLQSGAVILRYKHQFGNVLRQSGTGDFELTIPSLPEFAILSRNPDPDPEIGGEPDVRPKTTLLDSQTVTWIFPDNIEVLNYSSSDQAEQWALENNALQFRTSSGDPIQLTLNYRLRDEDKDGIPDALGNVDLCAETPVHLPVNSDGCPLDTDGDGIFDGDDECPTSPPGEPVTRLGCPVDFDGDGVPNHRDQCRNSAADTIVDSFGCESDSDEDGVPDVSDQCMGTPPQIAVNAQGCAEDSDKDSIPDFRDICADSRHGQESNDLGCNIKVEKMVLPNVTFGTGSSFLNADSRIALDRVAQAINFLPKHQHFEIGAHTDDQGTRTNNRSLSSRRASAVRKYLMIRGVSANRLTAKGYGESSPLVPNKSIESRQKNRRIELRRIQ
ncbi:MAG: OmpA family protein [Granulosicoccus sp.]|nr:OmpA family protein [Granulosicoccus sp.]